MIGRARDGRAAPRAVRGGWWRLAALPLLLALGARAEAQSACTVPNPPGGQSRTCSVTLRGTLSLPGIVDVRLSTSATNIAGAPVATDATFRAAGDTGLVVVGPLLAVRSTGAVSVTLVNAPTFTGPAPKPASDVHLGVSATTGVCGGIAMSPLATTPIAVQQGAPRPLFQSTAAVTGVTRQLCFRVWWRFATDAPGSYTLPLTVSTTAP
jgi:hypothetical protein